MFVPNFEAISHLTLVLKPVNSPKSKVRRKKRSQSKTAEVRQKYLTRLYVLDTLSPLPTNFWPR